MNPTGKGFLYDAGNCLPLLRGGSKNVNDYLTVCQDGQLPDGDTSCGTAEYSA
jgi:hypothetical protein